MKIQRHLPVKIKSLEQTVGSGSQSVNDQLIQEIVILNITMTCISEHNCLKLFSCWLTLLSCVWNCSAYLRHVEVGMLAVQFCKKCASLNFRKTKIVNSKKNKKLYKFGFHIKKVKENWRQKKKAKNWRRKFEQKTVLKIPKNPDANQDQKICR